jgi:uncharacterized membrane protein
MFGWKAWLYMSIGFFIAAVASGIYGIISGDYGFIMTMFVLFVLSVFSVRFAKRNLKKNLGKELQRLAEQKKGEYANL